MPEGKSDDLMEAAIRAVDAAREDLLLAKASDNKALLRRVAISMVHGALLAERQRCANVAEAEYEKRFDNRDGYPASRVHDFVVVARAIQMGILEPAPPSSTEER